MTEHPYAASPDKGKCSACGQSRDAAIHKPQWYDGKLMESRACDICNELSDEQNIWFFKSQLFPAGIDVDFLFELMEHPEWLLCPTCHELLRAKNITGMLELGYGINTPRLREILKAIYMSLINNLPDN